MSKTASLLCLVGFGFLIAVSAADFWRDKAYTQWTDDEVSKMLSNSPWAQSVKTTGQGGQNTGRRSGMGRRGGGWGMPGGGYPGGGYPGGGYPGGGGGYPGGGGGYPGGGGGGGNYPGGGGSMPQITVTVRWQTALPVREALLRQSGVTKTDDSKAAESLTAPVTDYVIAVVGLPERMPSRSRGRYGSTDDTNSSDRDTDRDRDADRLDQLKSTTVLNRKDRPSLFAEKVERDKDGSTILFSFPRTTPISLDDKEVEFVTRYGGMEIKHKFKLKEMSYQGRLEL